MHTASNAASKLHATPSMCSEPMEARGRPHTHSIISCAGPCGRVAGVDALVVVAHLQRELVANAAQRIQLLGL